jgi:hypothetical protein
VDVGVEYEVRALRRTARARAVESGEPPKETVEKVDVGPIGRVELSVSRAVWCVIQGDSRGADNVSSRLRVQLLQMRPIRTQGELMNFKNLLLIPALCLLPLVTGCGDDCKSSCDDAKKCSGANGSADCDKFCDSGSDLSDKAGCKSKWDDVVSCESDQKDVCDTKDTSCQAKEEAWSTCIGTYCAKTENQKVCTDFLATAP